MFKAAPCLTAGGSKRKDGRITGNKDVRLTIDRDLQQAAVDQLKGKHGAVVVLNPQTAKCWLSIANLLQPQRNNDERTWIKLEANQRDKPLVSRAWARTTFQLDFQDGNHDAAFLAGEQDTQFTAAAVVLRCAGANVTSMMAAPLKCTDDQNR